MISRIDGGNGFDPSNQCMLKFYEDREDIADNMMRPWKSEVGEPLEISTKLVEMIMESYKES